MTPVQAQVLAPIAAGASLSDAAAQAGVQHNSAGYWRRNSTKFKIALQHAALAILKQASSLPPEPPLNLNFPTHNDAQSPT